MNTVEAQLHVIAIEFAEAQVAGEPIGEVVNRADAVIARHARGLDNPLAQSYQKRFWNYAAEATRFLERQATGMAASEFVERRRELGLTQAALAARLGVTVQTVSNYETGRNPIPPHFRLALRAIKFGYGEDHAPQIEERCRP